MALVKSFIRYPGSKSKLVRQISKMFPPATSLELWRDHAPATYCEPFIGAGAMLSQVLDKLPTGTEVVAGDLDYWLICMWNAVKDSPQELCEHIDAFTPTCEAFYKFKEQDGDRTLDPVTAGFRKLALHQTSYSGLGSMAGGPLGGKTQKNKLYNPACRWKPARLKENIRLLNKSMQRFRRVTIWCRDFADILKGLPDRSFVYLDPPYFEKGPVLYKHNMNLADHERLSKTLKAARFNWVLSYDDHPEIRRLYSWAKFDTIKATYTMATAKNGTRPKNREVLIVPNAV